MCKSTLCDKAALWVCRQISHGGVSESRNQPSGYGAGPTSVPTAKRCHWAHLAEHFTALNISHWTASTSDQWFLMIVTSLNWNGHLVDCVMNLQKKSPYYWNGGNHYSCHQKWLEASGVTSLWQSPALRNRIWHDKYLPSDTYYKPR